MKKIKRLLLQLPEYTLILLVIFYWSSTGTVINPIAIVLITVLILQNIFKNRFTGIIIPVLLILTSLYMLLALMSEFSKFPVFNTDAKKLLFVGLSYFIAIMIVSGLMVYKYSTMDK